MAYFVPLAIVSLKKLWKATPFMLFGLYWSIAGLITVIEFIPGVTKTMIIEVNVVYNMLDMPIVFAIFYSTTQISAIKKLISIGLPVYLVAACVNAFIQGMNYDALKWVLAIGLVQMLIILIWEIIGRLQKIRHTSYDKAMLLLYAALLFQYGTYIIIYIFDYYLLSISNTEDNFIIYYVSTLVAICVAAFGYLIIGRQKSQLRQRSAQADSPLSTY